MDRPGFAPLIPNAIGAALAILLISIPPALSWLLPRTDALIARIIP